MKPLKLTKDYATLKDSFRNVSKDISQRILKVLEVSGSEILRPEHLENAGLKISLKSILILSEEMKRSINIFNENIRKIGSSDEMETGSQFYITDFGGSKTQFIELIKSIINENKERDEPPFNRLIPITFNGSIDLTAQNLGEKIEHDTARILTRQLEILQRDPSYKIDPHAFENFMDLLLEFRKVKNAPEHLEKIHNNLADIERISDSSPGLRMRISNIRQELSQLPIIDEERLLNIGLDIMEFASKYKIIYIFFFDECDDWLAKIEEESKWDPNFLKRQYFFRKLYDRISNLRLYQIYCLTPRVHETLRSERSDTAPGIQRISSDLIKVSSYGPYVQIREQGVYQGTEATEASLKWLILLEKVFQQADKEIFTSFLPILIEKIENKLSRRKANSTIISSIKSFIQLTEDIKNGQNQYNMADRNPSHYLTIGNIIEKTFASYLNFLNFNFLKKHQDVGNGNKIDGKFMSVKGDETEIFAEIKTFKEPSSFTYEKAEQVINCVKNPKNKAVFFLFSKNLTEEFVKNKFHEWKNLGQIPYNADIQNIFFIVIQDQTLLNSLVGFEQVLPSQLNDKLEHFDKLLRLLNKDFHGKLINIFPTREKVIEEITELKEFKEVKEIKKLDLTKKSYSQLLIKLKSFNDTIIRTSVEVVKTLGSKSKVYSYRKLQTIKNQITPLLKNSFEDAVEFLKQGNIIQETTEYLKFNWDIFDSSDLKNDPEGLMIQIFDSLLKIIPEEK